MQILKKLIRKLIYKEYASSETLVQDLRQHGAQVGEGVKIYAPNKTFIDKTTPWLLTIGNYVRIAEGVRILTHDYSWAVLKRYASENVAPGGILGSQGPVEIGSNVFIGMSAIITCGVKIGDNVIIGAGSVVTKDCESNSVYAGVPARKIMRIEEFYHKRKAAQFREAREIAIRYKKAFGKDPDRTVFSEYFMLFATREEATAVESFQKQMRTSANYDACVAYMDTQKPMFSSYQEFLTACYQEADSE